MKKNLTINIKNCEHPADDNYNLLENISITIEEGIFVSILGLSGSGKSTLLKIIAGLEDNFEGSIQLGSEEIKKPSKKIQLIFQDYRLLPWKTVSSNLEFAQSEVNRDEIRTWLDKVGLTEKANNYPGSLSGGEQALLSFVRAFIGKPQVLLLDEPFRSIDIKSKIKIQEILLDYLKENSKIITILVSHSIDDAVRLSNQIHILSPRPSHLIRTLVCSDKDKTFDESKIKAAEIAEVLLNLPDHEPQPNH